MKLDDALRFVVIAFVTYVIATAVTDRFLDPIEDQTDDQNDVKVSVQRSSTWLKVKKEKLPDLQQRLPGAIIIGISKCGTRALLSFLSMHPGVSCGTMDDPIPEINYFSHHYSEGSEWYRLQMPLSSPGQLTIEKSPRYFYMEEVPDLIKRYNRTIRLLAITCDPEFRFESQSIQNMLNDRRQGKPYRSIEERAVDSTTGELKITTEMRDGCYFPHMERWYNVFPRDQILLVDGEELKTNPYVAMKKVESFLGVKKYFTPANFYYNATKGFYCPVLDGDIQCLRHNKGRPHPDVAQSVKDKLRQFYKQCNKPFVDLVKMKFKWF